MAFQCLCCGSNHLAGTLAAREMMYGTREPFSYARCADCASLQLQEVPTDLSQYYPSESYPGWKPMPAHIAARPTALRRVLLGARTDLALGRSNLLGSAVRAAFGPAEFPFDWDWFRRTGVHRGSHIMDFGCGSGALLKYLRANGFRHLKGVDAFSGADSDGPELEITVRPREDWRGLFDLVMLHHSLEHIPDPAALLRELTPLLRAGGHFLIRIPLANSHAERHYGTDWVQLDAPRHLVLPSEKGMRRMAERLGLQLVELRYDSTDFQFLGSEQYRLDIPLNDKQRSWNMGAEFERVHALRAGWKVQAEALNAAGDGDQALFILRA